MRRILVVWALCLVASPAFPRLEGLQVQLNPHGIAPLTALVSFRTEQPVSVVMKLMGRAGGAPLIRHFPRLETTHELPVLGLYGGYRNQLELALHLPDDTLLHREVINIATEFPMPALPVVTIDSADERSMLPGMTLVASYGHAKGDPMVPMRAFIFDVKGHIRWYLDTADHADLDELFYACGPELLRNGNLFFGDKNSAAIYEVSLLGEVVNTWPLGPFAFHHDVIEKPDGNLLATATRKGSGTVEDQVVEIDRRSGGLVRVWDLRESLQMSRVVHGSSEVDWFHGNAVAYDETDDTILVSSRFQGVAKLSASNEVIWIMSPHMGWSENSRGENLTRRLLQPLDRHGNRIEAFDVLMGVENHRDFEWNWYQHAPLLMPNGNIMLFDNGDFRNFGDHHAYSRVVEYKVDDDRMTIAQQWSYGEQRGPELFSPVVSDVDFYPAENRVIMSAGSVKVPEGKIVEIDHESKQVIFEATVTPAQAPFGVTFHRTERIELF